MSYGDFRRVPHPRPKPPSDDRPRPWLLLVLMLGLLAGLLWMAFTPLARLMQ